MDVSVAKCRQRIDAFHARFNAACQRLGWKAGGHKAACKLLAAARALPAADLDRRYVVQLKLAGRRGLRDWADMLDKTGEQDVASVHREMAAGLAPRERVLFALEARHHVLLRFQMVPPNKRLGPPDLALFALRAILEPMADVPTLDMQRSSPHRPYAIWIPADHDTTLAEAVGGILAGAGLATSAWYVGGGFCAESYLLPGASGEPGSDLLLNTFNCLEPDRYSEDEEDEETEEGVEANGEAQTGAAARGGGRSATRVLLVGGLHVFGETAGEGEDPMLTAVAGALRSSGCAVEVAMYPKRGGRRAEEALAQRLTAGGDGGFAACVVLGLGSGDDFKPRNPTHPWGDGPWRNALTGWVRGGGVLVMNGERAAAAVARAFFGLAWTMEGDHYRRTDHKLNSSCPLLGRLARELPTGYNVKACMLGDVPPPERVYATAAGAASYSLVPSMSGAPVDEGRAAMAAARCGAGTVAFFGDVNWEPHTTAAVAALVLELVGSTDGAGARSAGA
ncbi:hypothetical protein GPECTOR_67g267 [Gonium pectorale]|uniref:Uncharacterized protein n=1 Tax=Gonium pectorale TaxID=33097 RepID=A0A150G3K1_GONPE|nr:hypothetical protein GPECTOR_67g267 [Gonium pectorale]|eukprot:KXZ44427.1 hypothetical protein GPECTOR_67g267 [Gonium pectorale]